MDKNLPDIDHLFRNALEDYTETPPDMVWEGIEAGLDTPGTSAEGPGGSGFPFIPFCLLLLTGMMPAKPTQNHRFPVFPVAGREVLTEMAKKAEISKKNQVAYTVRTEPFNTPNDFTEKRYKAAGETNHPDTENIKENKLIVGLSNPPLGDKDNEEGFERKLPTKDAVEKESFQDKNLFITGNQTNRLTQAKIPGGAGIKAATATGVSQNPIQSGSVMAGNAILYPASIHPLTGDAMGDKQAGSMAPDLNGRQLLPLDTFENNPGGNRVNTSQVAGSIPLQKFTVEPSLRKVPPIGGSPFTTGAPPALASELVIPGNARGGKKTVRSLQAYYRPEWQQKQLGRLENDRHDGNRNDRHAIRQQQLKVHSFTTGMLAGLQFSNGMMIQSGFSYFSQTSEKGKQVLRPRPDSLGRYQLRLDCAEGFTSIKLKNGNPPTPADSVLVTGATTKIAYIGLPLQISYPFRFGKFYAIPNAGLTFQWLLSGNVKADLVENSEKRTITENSIGGLKNSFLSGNAALQLEYKMSRSLHLTVTPAYRFSFSPVNQHASVQSFPAALGVGFGFRWIMP